MYSWNVASMKKSIMYDVLNVIDKANKKDVQNYIDCDHSLLCKDTYERYNRIFELAREYKDSIAAVLYVPESDTSSPRFTLLYSKLFEIPSFADLVSYIEEADKNECLRQILEVCLSQESAYLRNDLLSQISGYKADMLTVSMLNETKLPEQVKFSIVTLLFNYNEFLYDFIGYLDKLYAEIETVYNDNKNIFRYTSSLLKAYLSENCEEKLLKFDRQIHLLDNERPIKYLVVLSMMCLEFSSVLCEDFRIVCMKGLFSLQRKLHDTGFKIF